MAPKKKNNLTYYSEEQLMPDKPLILRNQSDEKIPKIKQTRAPNLYNKMIGEFMKQICQEDKTLSLRDKMLRAQELYRSWKETQKIECS
jgi:hypothetical protein